MRLRSTLSVSFVLATLACSAGVAQAAPYEQVSRLNGTDNFLSGDSINFPAGLSESGRYAIFGSITGGSGSTAYYVRDIQANRTLRLTGAASVHGFDGAEGSVLISRNSGDTVSLVLVSLVGAPDRTLWSGTKGLYAVAPKFSADGSTVVLNDREHNRAVSLNVATGALTTLLDPLDDGVSTGPGSVAGVSDDGRTAAVTSPVAYTGTSETRFYRDGRYVRTISGVGLLSPDGTAFVSVPRWSQSSGSQRVLTITSVVTGVAKSFPVPAVGSTPSTYADPVWTSERAAKVVVRVGSWTRQVDYATGAWSTFGGRFDGYVGAIARNGRFAEMYVRNHVALVDLTDAELVGGGDAWSPDVYLDASASTYSCHATPPLYLDRSCSLKRRIKFLNPAPFLPAPKRAAVTISASGLQLASGTLLVGQTLAGNLDSPVGISSTTTRATVTDFLGRQRTLTWGTRL